MKKLVFNILSAAILVWFPAVTKSQEMNKQIKYHFEKEITVKVQLNYLFYLPEGYKQNDEKKWPLILFLHGAGERGNDLDLVKKHGPPKIVEQKDLPFIIVSPQCPAEKRWSIRDLDLLLEKIIKDHRVEKNRIYLTGLSMGGYGTWEYATEKPERFAAIAPICGGGSPWQAYRLASMPVWVFHGAKDPVVPIEKSEEMVKALKKVNENVKFTVYPEATHDSWTETYDNPELYEWFLKQKQL
ncbi:MAG: alpha/beta hydrolase [Bacteroidales bacterium]|nr:alpha/beta hydrolase [Bacteroidales bacterium]